jgi:hypothetical protein
VYIYTSIVLIYENLKEAQQGTRIEYV